jgi:hypothetical protein
MTRDEFFALPIAERYGVVPREIDGKTVRVPVMNAMRAVWLEDDEPRGYFDDDGHGWVIVEVDGKRARAKA